MGKERNKDKNKDNIFKTRKEIIMLIIIIIIIILIDQLSKLLIQNIGEADIIPNVLNLKISTNSNMQNQDSQNTYIITNLIIIFIVSRFMISQNKFVDKKLKIFLSFILAGGISNLIERTESHLTYQVLIWIDTRMFYKGVRRYDKS